MALIRNRCRLTCLILILIVSFYANFLEAIAPLEEPERWDGLTPYTTTNGLPCVTPCEKRGRDFYWCYNKNFQTGFLDTHGTWSRCSPSPGTDYKGRPCESECQSFRDYFWCVTDSTVFKVWDYCGKTISSYNSILVRHFKTRHGKYCVSPCEYGNHNYSWCTDANGTSDYCSISPGYDNNGRKCRNNCDYHGALYQWCELEDGGWNYCGSVIVSSETQYTYLGSKCVTPCTTNQNAVNLCYDASGEERQCSIVSGLATNNKKCLSACDINAGDVNEEPRFYNWCWTSSDKSEWSLCSNVKDFQREGHGLIPRWYEKREYYPKAWISLDLTRTRSLSNIYAHFDEQGINRVTFFEKLERFGNNAQYKIDNNPEMQKWTLACLANWKQLDYNISLDNSFQRLANGGEENNEEWRGIRLDQRNRYVDAHGVEYLNLHMQVNGITRNSNYGRSTSIGEVQVPVVIAKENPQLVVNAFLKSIYEGYAVHIGRFSYDLPERSSNRRS